MTKDILDALTDALMGSGSLGGEEVSQKWYMVASDGKGGTQSYEAGHGRNISSHHPRDAPVPLYMRVRGGENRNPSRKP